MEWMGYLLAVSGLTFVAAGLLVGLFSLARLLMVVARDGLLPRCLAAVHPRTQTPVVAQCCVGAVVGELGLQCCFSHQSRSRQKCCGGPDGDGGTVVPPPTFPSPASLPFFPQLLLHALHACPASPWAAILCCTHRPAHAPPCPTPPAAPPPWFTPPLAAALIAFLVPLGWLSVLAVFGFLFAMWMVASALLFRRYYPDAKLRYTQ